MKRMSKDASLHESTVKAVANGALETPARARRRGGQPTRRATTYKAVKVDQRVMKRAKEINRDGRFRLVIEGPTSVLLVNRNG